MHFISETATLRPISKSGFNHIVYLPYHVLKKKNHPYIHGLTKHVVVKVDWF